VYDARHVIGALVVFANVAERIRRRRRRAPWLALWVIALERASAPF